MTDGKGEIIIYDEIQGKPRIEVKLADDTLWLSQRLMADLFEKDVDTISLHIKNIYAEAELEEKPTTTIFTVAQQEGKRTINRKVTFYNLDMILSVGYRVSSMILFRDPWRLFTRHLGCGQCNGSTDTHDC